MKKIIFAAVMLILLTNLVIAGGGLDSFLNDLNLQARADMNGFSARVSAQFGVPLPQVHAVIGTVAAPADAFMVFQLGQMTRKTPERVMQVY
jgi:hypothetical protein